MKEVFATLFRAYITRIVRIKNKKNSYNPRNLHPKKIFIRR